MQELVAVDRLAPGTAGFFTSPARDSVTAPGGGWTYLPAREPGLDSAYPRQQETLGRGT